MSVTTGTSGIDLEPPPQRRSGHAWPSSDLLVPLALLGTATLAFTVSLRTVRGDDLGDLGLITALPASYFVCIVVLTASFFRLLQKDDRPGWLLGLHLAAVVVFLHGITGFVEPVPRFPTAWVHAGFVEQIMREHTTLPGLDARFSWPGFFSASALVADAGGLTGALWFVRWAPVVFNLAALFPVLAIARAAEVSERARWTGLWLFCVANWVGQDYFAPQALNFFLYLVFAAVLLHYFRPTVEARASDRVAMFIVLLAVAAVAIVSHQLTPFAMLAATLGLLVGRRTTLRMLPVLLLVAALSWISYAAEPYWTGHLNDVTGGLGRVGRALGGGVGERLRGSDGHLLVLRARLASTLGLWLLAAIGIGRLAGFRLSKAWSRVPWSHVLLAAAPLSLVAVQSYGGEIMLRVYLFSLPFTALLAAAAFSPSLQGSSKAGTTVAALVSMVMACGFVLIRYGNERFESFTAGEVAAVRYVDQRAAPGDRIVAANPSLAWRDHDIGTYKFIGQIEDEWLDDPEAIAGYLKTKDGHDGYMLLTRSQAAYGEMVEGRPRGWLDGVRERALSNREVEVVFQNRDATVLYRPDRSRR